MPTRSSDGRSGADFLDDVGVDVGVGEKAVMVAAQGPAGKMQPGVFRRALDRPGVAAEEEIRVAAAGGLFKQGRREIGAHQVLAHADGLEPGGPANARPVGEDVVGRIEHVAVAGVRGGQVQRVGVGEVNGVSAVVLPLDKLLDQFDAAAPGHVGEADAEDGELLFLRLLFLGRIAAGRCETVALYGRAHINLRGFCETASARVNEFSCF